MSFSYSTSSLDAQISAKFFFLLRRIVRWTAAEGAGREGMAGGLLEESLSIVSLSFFDSAGFFSSLGFSVLVSALSLFDWDLLGAGMCNGCSFGLFCE